MFRYMLIINFAYNWNIKEHIRNKRKNAKKKKKKKKNRNKNNKANSTNLYPPTKGYWEKHVNHKT